MGLLGEIEAAMRMWGTLKDAMISDEEKWLLREARDAEGNMKGVLITMPGGRDDPPYMQVNHRDFLAEGDPSYAAIYRKAFATLIKRGYIDHQEGLVYILSADGWDAARKL